MLGAFPDTTTNWSLQLFAAYKRKEKHWKTCNLTYTLLVTKSIRMGISKALNAGLIAYFCLVLVVGLALNIAVLYVILASRIHRQIVSNIFLVVVLIADVLFCIFNAPYNLVSLTIELPPLNKDTVKKFDVECKASMFLVYSFSIAKILTLMLLSLDRFCALRWPFLYSKYSSKKLVLKLTAFVWLQAFATTLPATFKEGWVSYTGNAGSMCGFNWGTAKLPYVGTVMALDFVLPTIGLFVANIGVFVMARKQRKRAVKSRQQYEHAQDCKRVGLAKTLVQSVSLMETGTTESNTTSGSSNTEYSDTKYQPRNGSVCNVCARPLDDIPEVPDESDEGFVEIMADDDNIFVIENKSTEDDEKIVVRDAIRIPSIDSMGVKRRISHKSELDRADSYSSDVQISQDSMISANTIADELDMPSGSSDIEQLTEYGVETRDRKTDPKGQEGGTECGKGQNSEVTGQDAEIKGQNFQIKVHHAEIKEIDQDAHVEGEDIDGNGNTLAGDEILNEDVKLEVEGRVFVEERERQVEVKKSKNGSVGEGSIILQVEGEKMKNDKYPLGEGFDENNKEIVEGNSSSNDVADHYENDGVLISSGAIDASGSGSNGSDLPSTEEVQHQTHNELTITTSGGSKKISFSDFDNDVMSRRGTLTSECSYSMEGDYANLTRAKRLRILSLPNIHFGEQNESVDAKWNIILSTLLLVVFFFLTWFPFVITRLAETLTEGSILSPEELVITAALNNIDIIVNPLIILWSRRVFRNELKIRLRPLINLCCKLRRSKN